MAGSALIAQGIDRRRAILRFIKDFVKKEGCSPSIAEIAAGVELSSNTAVRHHLQVLRDEGFVDWNPSRYRSLHIISNARYPK